MQVTQLSDEYFSVALLRTEYTRGVLTNSFLERNAHVSIDDLAEATDSMTRLVLRMSMEEYSRTRHRSP